jgi:transposase
VHRFLRGFGPAHKWLALSWPVIFWPKEIQQMARKQYSKEFKEQACRLVIGGSHQASDAARELGLPIATLLSWLRRAGHRDSLRRPLDLHSNDPAILKTQLRDLENRLKRAEMERDILKKATAFFASQQP